MAAKFGCGYSSTEKGRYDRGIEGPVILLVCTANQCRSPMATGILQSILDERQIPGWCESAGLYDGGYRATGTGVEVLAARGIDIHDHLSRSLTEVDLEEVDLVLTMERRHLMEVIVQDSAVADRAFTLIDFVRRAEAAGGRPEGSNPVGWIAGLAEGRSNRDVLGQGDDEVDDPVGMGKARYEATADQLTDLLTRAVDALWPNSRPGNDAASTPDAPALRVVK